MKKRKILAITGIRSEYDVSYSVFDHIRNKPSLDIEIIACGAHLSSWHGNTLNIILRDGFKVVDKIKNLLSENSDSSRADGAGILIAGLARAVARIKPNFLLATGDREEPLAMAIVANYLKIPLAHIFGGDSAVGNADDCVRHAISKLAHLHFTACAEHKKRLIKMGEEEFRIFNVGNPALDRIRTTPKLNKKELSKLLNFDITNEPFVIILQHPLSCESDQSYKYMKIIMEAVKELAIKAIVIYPNTDPSSHDIIRAIEEYRYLPHIKIYKNLERLSFVNLMRQASCLIGNSSCGLLEAPFVKLPVINVGDRQKGRINAGNVIFVEPKKKLILDNINKFTYNKEFRKKFISKIKNNYGKNI